MLGRRSSKGTGTGSGKDKDGPGAAAMADYDHIPRAATLKPSRFKVKIPDDQLKELKTLLKYAKLGPKTFENQNESRRYGVSWKWMTEAKQYWESKYSWRHTESYINSFIQYEANVEDDDGNTYSIHFTGLFSENPAAIPLVLLHGWPGSFLEFLKILQRLRGKYTPQDLPYHVVVPSLPGYAFSSSPPPTKNLEVQDMALLVNRLMVGLGFEEGYVAHGGDIGSMVARVLAVEYDACKAMHLNFNIMSQPPGIDASSVSETEIKGLARAQTFNTFGNAYAREQGTRPATIGFVLSSSPLALLAWIGEKYLDWTDTDPSLDTILESVTLYWLTSTFPRAISPYIQFFGESRHPGVVHSSPKYHCTKPMGYSWFPQELAPMPVSWVRTTGNLVWHRHHTEGGHFAALEKPDLLLRDIEEFVETLK